MSDVKWIKIATDIFDNKKIKLIESMPDGDTIIVIWFKILVLAGTVNDDGSVYFTKDIPFTEQMLSTVFDRPLPVIQLALATFERFGMIEIVNDIIRVSNWEKYQNIDGLDRIREQTRVRVSNYRERKKLECNATSNATVTVGNALDIEEEKERDKEKEKVLKDISSESSPFILIPLNDGSEHPVSTKEVEEYKSLYPNVDVEQALRSMRGWCISNPTKRKTKRGVRNFITSWLSREQDRGRKPQQTQKPKPRFDDMMTTGDIDFEELEKKLVAN